jgi:hypothetical protein
MSGLDDPRILLVLFDVVLKIIITVITSIVPYLIGGFSAGLLLGGLLYWAMQRYEWLALRWKHARWLRVLAAAWLVLASGALVCIVAGYQGALQFAGDGLRKGPVRKDVLEPAGRICATGFQAFDLYCQNCMNREPGAEVKLELAPEQQTALTDFQNGRIEVNASQSLKRLSEMEAALAAQIRTTLQTEAQTRFSIQPGGLIDKIVEACLQSIASVDARKMALNQIGTPGRSLQNCLATLPAAAAASGNPDTITHAELSDHFVEHAILPLLLDPVTKFIRAQQSLVLALLALAVLLPPVVFRIIRYFEGHVKTAAPATPKVEEPVA